VAVVGHALVLVDAPVVVGVIARRALTYIEIRFGQLGLSHR